jgi:hypothetical protein
MKTPVAGVVSGNAHGAAARHGVQGAWLVVSRE